MKVTDRAKMERLRQRRRETSRLRERDDRVRDRDAERDTTLVDSETPAETSRSSPREKTEKSKTEKSRNNSSLQFSREEGEGQCGPTRRTFWAKYSPMELLLYPEDDSPTKGYLGLSTLCFKSLLNR
ncbi:hypothetical protein F2Q69_00004606 [Brassica cretica]|uniref:Uncharacterized protein n=1 Tax=Brassica cretica TaxID=69181 RepID=A0A8S9PJT1_BRACR|nr:hypothetical protein F2Q69_00004606 [Brassica cretica]